MTLVSTDDGGRALSQEDAPHRAEPTGEDKVVDLDAAHQLVEPDLLWIESVTERLFGAAGRSTTYAGRSAPEPAAGEPAEPAGPAADAGRPEAGTPDGPRTSPRGPIAGTHPRSAGPPTTPRRYSARSYVPPVTLTPPPGREAAAPAHPEPYPDALGEPTAQTAAGLPRRTAQEWAGPTGYGASGAAAREAGGPRLPPAVEAATEVDSGATAAQLLEDPALVAELLGERPADPATEPSRAAPRRAEPRRAEPSRVEPAPTAATRAETPAPTTAPRPASVRLEAASAAAAQEMPAAVLRAALRDALPDDTGLRRSSPLDAIIPDPTAVRPAAAPSGSVPGGAPTLPAVEAAAATTPEPAHARGGRHRFPRPAEDLSAADMALRLAFRTGDDELAAAAVSLVAERENDRQQLRMVQAYLDALLDEGGDALAGARRLRRMLGD